MRKIGMFNHVTLDGYFAGPKGEIDWVSWNEELARYAREKSASGSADTLIFGRVTYELMAAYWPTPKGREEDTVIADFMNNSSKIVFSKTMKKADWNNTKVYKNIDNEELQAIKSRPGKDIVIFGSGSIVQTLTNLGLIDDYRVLIHPLLLGSGKTLFTGLTGRTNLKLVNTETFHSGAIVLHYQKEGAKP